MGWNKYVFMENSKKIAIVLTLSLVLLVICFGVKYEGETEHHTNAKNQILIDTIAVEKVKDIDGKIVSSHKIIDKKSFQNLNTSLAYKEGVKNEYYLSNPIDNYFIDNNYVYVLSYLSNEKSILERVGNKNEFKLIGGGYLKLKSSIYWRGEKLKNVNSEEFKTFNALRTDSEWDATLGYDGTTIYSGLSVLNKSQAENLFFINDSILKKYFPE